MAVKPSKTKKISKLEISTRAAEQLGHAIYRHRERSGLTQMELAKKAGIRQATVSKIEKGIETTSIGSIYAVCAALGIEIVLRERSTTEAFRPEEIFG